MIKKVPAKISRVQSLDNLNLVTFDVEGQTLTMVSLDLNEKVKIGTSVSLNIKPTSVAIAKNIEGELSYSNQLLSKVVSVDNGELLANIVLCIGEVYFESIITFAASQRMNLQVDDEVVALVKANEISIAEVY